MIYAIRKWLENFRIKNEGFKTSSEVNRKWVQFMVVRLWNNVVFVWKEWFEINSLKMVSIVSATNVGYLWNGLTNERYV